jgi:hypothetical protein
MDQHHRLSGAVDQVMNPDAARVDDLRLDRASGTLLPKKDQAGDEKTFSDRAIGPLKGETNPGDEAVVGGVV